MNKSPKSHFTLWKKEEAKDPKMFKIGEGSLIYILMLSATGLRPGELLAMKWDNSHSYGKEN